MGLDSGAGKTDASFLPMYSGIASSIGRLVFGRIADLKCCIRLYLCQAAVLGMSVAAFLVPGLGSSYSGLVFFAFARGLFEGCYIMVNPVVTRELVGKEKLSYALGASYLLMFVPRILGPPIAGWIFDAFKSYDIAFHYTGAVALLSCCMMFAIPCFEPRMRMNNKWKLSEEGKEGKQGRDQEPHEENKLGRGKEIHEEKELGRGEEIDEEKKLGWGQEVYEEKQLGWGQETHEENKLGRVQEIHKEKELGRGEEIDEENKLGWGQEIYEENTLGGGQEFQEENKLGMRQETHRISTYV